MGGSKGGGGGSWSILPPSKKSVNPRNKPSSFSDNSQSKLPDFSVRPGSRVYNHAQGQAYSDEPLATGPKRNLEGKYVNWGEVFKSGAKWGVPTTVLSPLGIGVGFEAGRREYNRQVGEQSEPTNVPNIKNDQPKQYGSSRTFTGSDGDAGGSLAAGYTEDEDYGLL